MPAKHETPPRHETKSPPNGAHPFANFSAMTAWPDAALAGRAHEILSQAAQDVWAGQLELMRLETEQISKAWFPFHHNGDGAAASSEQWHEDAEKVITQMRSVGDAMRNCGWQLFETYANSFKTHRPQESRIKP